MNDRTPINTRVTQIKDRFANKLGLSTLSYRLWVRKNPKTVRLFRESWVRRVGKKKIRRPRWSNCYCANDDWQISKNNEIDRSSSIPLDTRHSTSNFFSVSTSRSRDLQLTEDSCSLLLTTRSPPSSSPQVVLALAASTTTIVSKRTTTMITISSSTLMLAPRPRPVVLLVVCCVVVVVAVDTETTVVSGSTGEYYR